MWQAADPNGDALAFQLFFQREDTSAWVPLTEKPAQGEPKFQWTTRGVPDGRYRVKVVATDQPANPAGSALTDARITDPFIIDNTPPMILKLAKEQAGDKVTLKISATDALSPIAKATATVDAGGEPLHGSPGDGVWDERSESVSIEVDLADYAPGPHLLIVNVSDAAGNTASAAVEVVKP
jgi:hypothetical protein